MKEPYDLLIDRTTIFGNPYSHKDGTLAKFKVETRQESIEKFREYLLDNPHLLDKLREINPEVLGCWCKDPDPKKSKACHGDIYVELSNRKVDLENL